ncbi:hypothetical protein [Bailinhaonella thermotolerans]|uniref:Uncharacterized protein n=1 Tax=Bailinhaonella thermotolerans TaxID=1070861 RepID=A0A3A4BNC7_9ACTN|nr:hypothetical protein [Bailinhaonella thermotolerans]RJL32564.1 hypothetical protein D5H75_13670 [Bailinhaonella thermotolerans]
MVRETTRDARGAGGEGDDFLEMAEEAVQEHVGRLEALGEVLRGCGLRTLLVRKVRLSMGQETGWRWVRHGRPELIVYAAKVRGRQVARVEVLDGPEVSFVVRPAGEEALRARTPAGDVAGVAAVVEPAGAVAGEAGEVLADA